MDFLHAILAAVLGTVAMTWSSTTEMYLEGRSESVVPGKATNKILRLIGVPEFADDSKALKILSHLTHWIYGAAWGALYWVFVSVADLNPVVAGVPFFLAVWIIEQIELPMLGIGVPWPWTWGKTDDGYVWKYNLLDAWHHVVYAAGTVAGWYLIGWTV